MAAGVRHGGAAVALAACLTAAPCAAMSWDDFVASFGPHTAPANVLEYLRSNPMAQAAPRPRFTEIRTETVDGVLAQVYRLSGFDGGFSHLEGVREERSQGTARSGRQTLTMTTALGGLVLVALDNKTTGAFVALRRIEIDGKLFPPAEGGQGTMKFERVQLSDSAVVEEFTDCAMAWIAPIEDNPRLTLRCTGSNKQSKPNSDGSIDSETSPVGYTSTWVFRRDVGWIFDQRTKVLDFKPADKPADKPD
jgi:hypothetical protein